MIKNRVRARRRELGLRAEDVAVRSGTAMRTIQELEGNNGCRPPRAGTLFKLAQALECKVDDIFYMVPDQEDDE